jgi:hypothetical protein
MKPSYPILAVKSDIHAQELNYMYISFGHVGESTRRRLPTILFLLAGAFGDLMRNPDTAYDMPASMIAPTTAPGT